jgi:methionyl-tRNA formyltransferase
MRIVFMGSPTFAVPALERLRADGHTLPLVVTQPDRPAGRGQPLTAPPVKAAAARHGLPVLQPPSLREPAAQAALIATRPELIVVVAFGQFLPGSIRSLPPGGCLNIHASLLPRYRGAAPINWALIRGETETGVSIMRVEARMDAGPILLRQRCPIRPEDDAGSLHDRLASLGAAALAEALALLGRGEARWQPQDETAATTAPKLGDADCRLDLSEDVPTLVNRIRGLAPVPGAYLPGPDGRRLRVLRAGSAAGTGPRGAVLETTEAALVVGTDGGALALLEVQPEGKRRMTGAEYARGRRLAPGMFYV